MYIEDEKPNLIKFDDLEIIKKIDSQFNFEMFINDDNLCLNISSSNQIHLNFLLHFLKKFDISSEELQYLITNDRLVNIKGSINDKQMFTMTYLKNYQYDLMVSDFLSTQKKIIFDFIIHNNHVHELFIKFDEFENIVITTQIFNFSNKRYY